MKSFNLFKEHHDSNDDDLRLGQRFVVMYIVGSFPVLYYADDQEATRIIRDWLSNHQYYDILPVVKEQFKNMER
jgi:hypothetical protein